MFKSFKLSNLKLNAIDKTNTAARRKNITTLSLLPITAAAMLFLGTADVEARSTEISTIYHVFYGEEKVGIVDDKEIITDFKQAQIQKALEAEKYENFAFSLSEELNMISETVFTTNTYNDRTLANLENLAEVKAESYEIIIDEEKIAHIPRGTNMENFKNDLILDFVDEEAFENYENFLENQKEDEEIDLDLDIGERLITDIDFSQQVEWKESLAHPDDILHTDEALKMIKQGTLEEEIYQVEKGDVLGTIAEKHDLSIDELLEINPNINDGSLLQIGDELSVTVLVPLVDVVVEEVVMKEEDMAYKTVTEEDSDMWKGDIEIRNEGQDGKKIVKYATSYENGQATRTDNLLEDIIKEPVNKLVVKGTKTSPSRGTGKLSWPAVGGYISSHQGPRWGSYHKGIDIARPSNRAILAADNGTVSSAGWENGYGNTVRINHNNGMQTVYAHLESIHVNTGKTVGKGQEIGRMGTTGNSTGIHLHFEVYKNGSLKNPMDYLR